ncbi:transposase [Arthrobacter sp. NPDC080031]|uniref:transposase n=1 Tax=Arthrobacter sp. NPDC080031 TaxID=3155918 RepID=UPI00345019B0
MAAPHRCLGRHVPPGQARQRHAHRGPASLTQQVHGRRGRTIDPVWANRRLLLRAGNTLSDSARDRLSTVFATDDVTGKLQAAWLVKEQLRALLATGSLADAAAAKDSLQSLIEKAAQPETNRLWRTVCRWWKEIEVLIVTGATTAKVEANNTTITKGQAGDSPTHATTTRVSCCAVPPKQRYEHPSRQNIHHEPRRAGFAPKWILTFSL